MCNGWQTFLAVCRCTNMAAHSRCGATTDCPTTVTPPPTARTYRVSQSALDIDQAAMQWLLPPCTLSSYINCMCPPLRCHCGCAAGCQPRPTQQLSQTGLKRTHFTASNCWHGAACSIAVYMCVCCLTAVRVAANGWELSGIVRSGPDIPETLGLDFIFSNVAQPCPMCYLCRV